MEEACASRHTDLKKVRVRKWSIHVKVAVLKHPLQSDAEMQGQRNTVHEHVHVASQNHKFTHPHPSKLQRGGQANTERG